LTLLPSAEAATIGWLLLPFLAAFLAALLPSLGRPLTLICCLATAAVALAARQGLLPPVLELLGPQGVELRPDAFAAPFLLLNALICAAVLLDGWRRSLPGPFPLLLMVLHGGLDSAFVAADLVSLYVTLEVVGISAFLLILTPRSRRSLWIALRYLLISNTVMLFFLVGAAVVYQQEGSFRFTAVAAVRGGGALALLLVGLLTKSGLFVSGLWLPRTHAEAPAEVSALLSGVVVTAGLCPLLRLAMAVPAIAAVLPPIGLASGALGILFALFDADAKRLLAWSTLSQLGLVALAPAAAGGYALAHGLGKGALFLAARRFPSRVLAGWRERPLPTDLWWTMWIGSLSIVGLPPLLGFFAKARLEQSVEGWSSLVLPGLMVGTTAVYARLWGAPRAAAAAGEGPLPPAGTLLLLAALLVPGLQLAVGRAVPWSSFGKTALIVLTGLAVHQLLERLRRRDGLRLPDLEGFGDLLGGIGVVGAALLVVLQR
jgi:multicomponent Na+:H+ antiporter subunit D